ncbi:hypothetical protein ACFYZ8_06175 [Streptomyces sp. NPDC001668]|uniref:hypothetical protein n=1 Tax=unclassified Streptomyces TaxID=2593676 RepID=UPI0036C31A95
MATLPQIDGLNRSASEFEPDVDEFDAVGLEKVPSEAVRPPRIKGTPTAFECTVEHFFSSPDGLNNAVWDSVVRFYVRNDLHLGGRIDFGALAPVGRLADRHAPLVAVRLHHDPRVMVTAGRGDPASMDRAHRVRAVLDNPVHRLEPVEESRSSSLGVSAVPKVVGRWPRGWGRAREGSSSTGWKSTVPKPTPRI